MLFLNTNVEVTRKTVNSQTPLLCIFIYRMFNNAEMYASLNYKECLEIEFLDNLNIKFVHKLDTISIFRQTAIMRDVFCRLKILFRTVEGH